MYLKLNPFRKLTTSKTYFIRDFNINSANFCEEIQAMITPILTNPIRKFNRNKAYFKQKLYYKQC